MGLRPPGPPALSPLLTVRSTVTGREPFWLSSRSKRCSRRSRRLPAPLSSSDSRCRLGGSARRSPKNCGEGAVSRETPARLPRPGDPSPLTWRR